VRSKNTRERFHRLCDSLQLHNAVPGIDLTRSNPAPLKKMNMKKSVISVRRQPLSGFISRSRGVGSGRDSRSRGFWEISPSQGAEFVEVQINSISSRWRANLPKTQPLGRGKFPNPRLRESRPLPTPREREIKPERGLPPHRYYAFSYSFFQGSGIAPCKVNTRNSIVKLPTSRTNGEIVPGCSCFALTRLLNKPGCRP